MDNLNSFGEVKHPQADNIDTCIYIKATPIDESNKLSADYFYRLSDYSSADEFNECMQADFASSLKTEHFKVVHHDTPTLLSEVLSLIDDTKIDKVVWGVLQLQDDELEQLLRHVEKGGFELDSQGDIDLLETLNRGAFECI